MKKIFALLSFLVIASLGAACSSDNTGNTNTAPSNGVVETNANISKNMNANTAPSNVGVVVNNNGNKNTAGVSPINSNTVNTNSRTNVNGKSNSNNANKPVKP